MLLNYVSGENNITSHYKANDTSNTTTTGKTLKHSHCSQSSILLINFPCLIITISYEIFSKPHNRIPRNFILYFYTFKARITYEVSLDQSPCQLRSSCESHVHVNYILNRSLQMSFKNSQLL